MPRRLTTEEFIEKAKSVHGHCYDYSQVEYVNYTMPVTIICPDHGPFLQPPRDHLATKGCRECAGNQPLTAETFIEKAQAIHGNRYDYSQVEYVNNKTPVTIICPDHGSFTQSPSKHLHNRGCHDCGGTKRLTTETFIEKAKAVHGDRYDYSSVNYVNAHTNVTIICPDHRPFEQSPTAHLHNESGCPDCGGRSHITTETFIEKAKAVHGDRYDYSQVEYVNKDTPVTIICPDHGPFPQAPSSHVRRESGCPDCANMALALLKASTTIDFIEQAKTVHGDRYDYSRVDYKNARTDVTIICPDHGPFQQVPQHHLAGSGCADCAETGFNPNERGILYYVAIKTDDGDTRYKIGITNRSVEERFRALDLVHIRILKTWRFAIGRAAADREQEVLRQHAGDRYFGPDILRDGNTELFTHDILGLDNRDEEHV